MLSRTPRRPAFTLVELLVVISIIVILVALTATAVLGVRRGMQKTNAEATLQKLDQNLRQKVKGIRDQIQDDTKNGRAEAEYAAAKSLTGNNSEGAKAIMLYARLKQQLPMSYAEARTPFTIGSGSTYTYQPSPAFQSLGSGPFGAATLEQSAVCLYLALAPMGLDGLENQVGTVANNQKTFVDGTGMPVAFIRVLYDGNNNELNLPPLVVNSARDPYDPDNKATAALTALWGGTTQLGGPQLTDAGPYQSSPYRAATNRNHTMALISAGPNNEWIEAPSNSILDGDNLFSYRLRKEGAKGD